MNPVDTFVRYAAACRDVGHVGITTGRIRELASRDDGIGLAALQADIAALTAAADHAQSALSEQRTAIGYLGAGWRGRSGSIATDLLERHCTSAANILNSLVGAADILDRLRGRLTRLLAERDEAGVRIAARRSVERPRWLACAEAVLAGTADRATADEVRTRIAPFLDADVAGEWAGAVSSVSDAVDMAYRQAATALAARLPAGFDVPSGVARAPVPVAQRRAALAVRGSESAPIPPGADMPIVSSGAPGFAGGTSEPAFGAAPGGVLAGHALDPGGRPLPDGLPRAEVPELSGPGAESDRDPEPEAEPEAEPDLESDAESEPRPDPDPQVASAAEAPSESQSESDSGPGQAGAESAIAAADPVPPAGVFGAVPEPEPSQLEPLAAEAGSGVEERTPCEIAADALPQIGQ